jgi:hypothetical protein
MISKLPTLLLLLVAVIAFVLLMFSSIDDSIKKEEQYAKALLLEVAKSNYFNIYTAFNMFSRFNTENLKETLLKNNKNVEHFTHNDFITSSRLRNFEYKITSYNPSNLASSVDKFEDEALKTLQMNSEKDYFYKMDDTLEHFDFFGVLRMEPSCLGCHAKEGNTLGSVRGGVRIEIPMNLYHEKIMLMKKNALFLKGIIILMGVLMYHVLYSVVTLNYRRQKDYEAFRREYSMQS